MIRKLFSLFIKRLVVLIIRIIVTLVYRTKISGKSNLLLNKNKKSIIICNHCSYLDPVLLTLFLPYQHKELVFAINTHISKIFWIKPFLRIIPTITIDPNNPVFLNRLYKHIELGKKIIIFPEGRTSTTGSLMKIYQGVSLLAEKSNASLIPIRLSGTEFIVFSKLNKCFRNNIIRKKININIGTPFNLIKNPNLDLKSNRKILSNQIYQKMSDMIVSKYELDIDNNIFKELIYASKKYGKKTKILGDKYQLFSYQDIINKTILYTQYFKTKLLNSENILILLPNSVEYIYIFLALTILQKPKFIIDYTKTLDWIIDNLSNYKIGSIITSESFIKSLKFEKLIKYLEENKVQIIFLEEAKFRIFKKKTLLNLIENIYFKCTFLKSKLLKNSLENNNYYISPYKESNISTISDYEIKLNILQVRSKLDLRYYDIVLNTHFFCFGYSIIFSLLPLFFGIKSFIVHRTDNYNLISELLYSRNITMFFSTGELVRECYKISDTFNFYKLRLIILEWNSFFRSTKKIFSEKLPGIRFSSFIHNESLTLALGNQRDSNEYENFLLLPNISNSEVSQEIPKAQTNHTQLSISSYQDIQRLLEQNSQMKLKNDSKDLVLNEFCQYVTKYDYFFSYFLDKDSILKLVDHIMINIFCVPYNIEYDVLEMIYNITLSDTYPTKKMFELYLTKYKTDLNIKFEIHHILK